MSDVYTPEAPADEGLSLRDELATALAADTASQTGETQAPATQAAPASETASQAAQRARDEAGRFAKQAEPATAKPVDPKTPTGATPEPPSQETIRVPPGLSAATKAEFSKLPQHVQQDILKFQADVEQAKTTWDQKAAKFNALDQILAPRRERLQLAGLDDSSAVRALFAAQDMLESKPVEAIAFLARQYGVDLRRYAQPGQGPAQQQVHPDVARLYQEVNTLKSALAQQQQTASQATNSQHVQTIQQFQSDPKNIYFENVRNDMATLIRSGQARDLQDAYDKATWASPEIRPLLLRAQQETAAAEAQAQAKARAQAARHASGSVTGSPTPGSSPAGAAPASSIRDELAKAFADAS
jgi:hypothetical protein